MCSWDHSLPSTSTRASPIQFTTTACFITDVGCARFAGHPWDHSLPHSTQCPRLEIPPTSPETRVLSTVCCTIHTAKDVTVVTSWSHLLRCGWCSRGGCTLGICTLDPPTHPSFATLYSHPRALGSWPHSPRPPQSTSSNSRHCDP
jgi:hypothetical protein